RSAPSDPADLADLLRELVREGGCAACIVNTVKRAQQLYREFSDEEIESLGIDLFHARYPSDERREIEERVLVRFGKEDGKERKRKRPPRAILIATQVVEQSLDLDFDVMVSDFAPV